MIQYCQLCKNINTKMCKKCSISLYQGDVISTPTEYGIKTNVNITYEDLYNIFLNINSKLKPFVIDYRPSGNMSLIIWFNNGMSMIVKYNKENKIFELCGN